MKTIITYGVFDLFHEGHLSLLKRAKALGDRLIVGVITDQFAYERGKYTVLDPLQKRLEHVLSCPDVDEVIVEDHFGQKIEDIERYHVDVFAIGDDWLGKFDYLKDYCEVVYLPRTPGISSTSLRLSDGSPLRIGIIGCGRITERFLRESAFVREVQVTDFYHPNPDSSESVHAFRNRHPEMNLSRTLEKLFDRVNAVYIASPHGTHADYVKAALEMNCHVLCEKPMSFRKQEAEELFALAEKKGLVLMEGIKTAYCPGFLHLISLCRSGVIGRIRDVDAVFTRLTARDLREWKDDVYGGSFTEFGSYVLLPVVKLLGRDLTWDFHSLRNGKVDSFTRGFFRSDEKSASVRTGIGVKSKGELVISGTEGFITVYAPWWKTTGFEIGYEDPYRKRRYDFSFEGDGLRYEIADFLCRIRGDSGRDYKLLPQESILFAEIFEGFQRYRESI